MFLLSYLDIIYIIPLLRTDEVRKLIKETKLKITK